jgi:hypothetical protein
MEKKNEKQIINQLIKCKFCENEIKVELMNENKNDKYKITIYNMINMHVQQKHYRDKKHKTSKTNTNNKNKSI